MFDNPDGGDAAEDCAEEDDVADPAVERPQTRADMNKLREGFDNNRQVACHFYKDRTVQMDMRVLYLGGRHLAHEFSEALRHQKLGQAPGLHGC